MQNAATRPGATTDAADARPSLASTTMADDSNRPHKAPSSGAASQKSRSWRATLYLHISSIVISIIYVIITIVMSQVKYGVTTVAFYAWVGLAAPVLSLLAVSGPELAARFFRPGNNGWIPAVHIGLNLFLWLVAAGMGGWMVYAFEYMDNYSVDFGDWEYGCPSFNRGPMECWGVPLYPHFRAILAFLFILMVIHVAIFGIAIDQHKRRQQLKKGRVGTV